MTQPYYTLKRELNVPERPFVVLSYGEDEKPNVLRGLAKTHWCAHVPSDDEMLAEDRAFLTSSPP